MADPIEAARCATASAHGRVNLIGEHTDYHEGYVLPALIPQTTSVHLSRREDSRVRVCCASQVGAPLEYDLGHEKAGRGWLDYIQGATQLLRTEGVDVPGLDITIQSAIPSGAGLSSSAALIVSLLRGLRCLLSLPHDDVQIAKMAQRVEAAFVGAPVGVMDGMVSSLGRQREALLLDTRTLISERIPLPSSLDIIVIDSGVPRSSVSGEYALRRKESFVAAAWLGVRVLRDLEEKRVSTPEDFPAVLARRVCHITSENQRVLQAADALRHGDGPKLGALFAESHDSMRHDYQISTPEIDTLVSIGREHPDVYGARMTGGGFGGSVVMVTRADRGHTAALRIMEKYAAATLRRPRLIT